MSFENNQQSKSLESVESQDKKQESICTLNLKYIPDQINSVFSNLCELKGIEINEQYHLLKLFNIVNSIFNYLNKENDLHYFLTIESCLELNNFIKFTKNKNLSESIRNSIQSYLNELKDYNSESIIQKKTTIVSFNNTAKKILTVLNSQSLDKSEKSDLPENDFMIGSDHKTKTKTAIINTLSLFLEDKHLNFQTKELLIESIDKNIKAVNTSEKSFLYDFSQGLLEFNTDILFKGVDTYINNYLKTKRGNYTIKNMTLEHKIELFYSDYFARYKFGKGCFIEQLITHYNKNVFFSFMKKYNIPFNIPVPNFTYNYNEDGDMALSVEYKSLAELSSEFNSDMLKDLIEEGINIWEHFAYDVIINDAVFSYAYCPIELSEKISERQLCFMIEKGAITHKLEFALENIFYGLLENRSYISFVKLYEKAKKENPDFNLRDYSKSDMDMLSLYFNTKLENNIEKPVIDIFVKEQFDINNKTIENLTALDYLKANNKTHEHMIQVLSLLEPLLPEHYIKSSLFKDNIISNLIKPKVTMMSWYNEDEMTKHLTKSTGGRVSLLESILTKYPSEKPLLKIEDESFFLELENKLPNFKEVIDYYKGQFRQNYYSDKKRINPILLLGEPGIGKTYFSKEFAQYLETGYSFIDMGSLTSSWILSGASGTWQDSKQGKILDILMKSPTFNPIVLLDEVDKSSSGNHNPTVVLYQLLEEINAKEFVDEFLDFPFDASGIIYIACANTINTLSEPLLSRFKVFNVPSPTSDQLDLIIKNIYQETVKNNSLFEPSLKTSIINMLKNNSLREVKILIEEGVTNALLEYSRDQLNAMVVKNEKITLKEVHFRAKQVKKNIGF